MNIPPSPLFIGRLYTRCKLFPDLFEEEQLISWMDIRSPVMSIMSCLALDPQKRLHHQILGHFGPSFIANVELPAIDYSSRPCLGRYNPIRFDRWVLYISRLSLSHRFLRISSSRAPLDPFLLYHVLSSGPI